MTVRLYTSTLACHAHEAVVLPWLQNVATSAVKKPRAATVILPLRADAYHLKGLALQAGINLFGVHFLTPADARDRLATHTKLELQVLRREHLRLFLATAAERLQQRGDDRALASVAGSPEQLLKAIDLVGDGGWKFDEAGPARLRPVVAEFQKLLAEAGFCLMQDADRALLDRSRSMDPCFGELLVTGFNALHWPMWPLLEACVRSCESAQICLTDPRLEAGDLDAAWVGTWEQAFGAAAPVELDPPPSPFASLLEPESNSGTSNEAGHALQFLVGENAAEQARAIVSQALQYLAEPECERLGILFPAAGALSRHVAALLAQLDVPHHDGLAHQAPGAFEESAWTAWLGLQENPRLPALLQYLQARPADLFANLHSPDAADELQRVFQELLIDDLAVIQKYLAEHSRRDNAPALARALQELPILPERAPLAEFAERSEALFRSLGWEARAQELTQIIADLHPARTLILSRRSWLRWLGEMLESWRATRSPAGRHPYSRLLLLPYPQAESQSWTHLIAAGLNEGEWPPSLEDAGLLDEEETDALNRRLRDLNARATTQGSQGEGHVAMASGKAFCLGPAQRRALANRQFFNTVESVTTKLAVCAQLHDEAAPDRPFNPGQFFFQLHFKARGKAPGTETMRALRERTAKWLEAGAIGAHPPVPDLAEVRQTKIAFDARRKPEVRFGEYEFALRLPPQPGIRLGAGSWERALAVPALVWLDAVLGVGAEESSDETPWALAQGNWVHRWLRAISGTTAPQDFAPLPGTARELHERVRTAARAFRDQVADSFVTPGRSLPEWWISTWEQALGISAALAEGVAGVPNRTHAATEWKLGDAAIPVGQDALNIRGRIDLLLTTGPSIENSWLVDYKTGHRQPLSLGALATGDGLQLALYALALRAAGAKDVGLSLLTPGSPLTAPQLTIAQLDELGGLWQGLLAMQQTGVFGMHGALRSEYGPRGEYPLATLAIDEDILAGKWAATHPDLVPQEEEA